MPIQLHYDKTNNILLATASGRLTLADLQQTGQTIVSSTEYSPHVDTLWDLRNVDARNIDREFLNNLVGLRQQQFKIRQDAKLALVANSNLNFGLSRMYEMMSGELQQATHVFKNIDAALAWLKEK